ncbi:glycosyltransferase family A protein [uncultured Williamsia sp.]|uniref:glycosyltransferase family A protein n=1 Tax=uncultured Williamsia sp. TaxID=259311 RepID=UPI002611608A|nr:glycosyltransferase family A protein [uncultured Williamsia sp.]
MKVSVVIPTIGRASLSTAIDSVLAQRFDGELELIVVSDSVVIPELAADNRVRRLRVGPGAGANAARQCGIDASSGDVIALLDDDDVWRADKIACQLRHAAMRVDLHGSHPWVSATSTTVTTHGRTKVWPRRVITAHEDYAEYMFRLRSVRMGGSFLQTSTMLFPRWIGRDAVRFDPSTGIHDDFAWMLDFRDAFPTAPILQTSEPLVAYAASDNGISHSFAVDKSVRFGRTRLADRPDLLADFLLTFPVTRAVDLADHRRIRALIREAVHVGRPSRHALERAVIEHTRAVVRSSISRRKAPR